jgi:hypothetical protein
MAQDKPEGSSGPHRCIATANTITDMIFRYLRARCAAQGGTLSFEDLDDASVRFAESVPSGFDLFETIYLRCMRASGTTAAALFTRKTLLTTLLGECGQHAAQAAFAQQARQFGAAWLRRFFDGLACYIRESICKDADYQLIAIYVQAAKKLKDKLSAAELLRETEVQSVLRECLAPMLTSEAPPAATKALIDTINRNITRGSGSDSGKVTPGELQRFLRQMSADFDLTPKHAGKAHGAAGRMHPEGAISA